MPKTKRTWQPKKTKRLKKHGFRKRMSTPGGKNVIKRRKSKGRKRIAVSKRSKVENKK
ncbi:MAG TPA: 50S ribosomal protein L34 [bacterium]|jgi:large subunit ribosomal protein L34|nr:50S ribosomal protein L34 [bacterium]HOV97417.1 50S ribosomal protein L34 [bacterium]HQG58482.1 50S ribosomal protein L34 [bacterium]HQG78838.1 50S ribosomal protein L34 [bacterium]HQK41789.1 50S ribosomal protein L34 [bacterium]